jgi:glycosyltransferase involved in cell wall biosynthesis
LDTLVTIAIPTYKRLSLLKEAVDSVLHQKYENIEIIIRQDPTPEGLNEEIENWGRIISSSYANITYYSNSINLGLAGNWNALASVAKGEYIMIIGDDDRLLPDCISTLIKGIDKGADVCFSNHYIIDGTGERILPLDEFTVRFNRLNLKKGFVENPEKVIWQNAISITACLMKTSLVKAIGFKADLNTPEIELFLRINQKRHSFYFTPEYLVEYRLHAQSATAGGLHVHRLMHYLINMPVLAENQIYKTDFLLSLSFVGVKNLIKENNRKEARSIIFSRYFGLKKMLSVKGAVLILMLVLPSALNKYIIDLKK